jgi:hypothetical protein
MSFYYKHQKAVNKLEMLVVTGDINGRTTEPKEILTHLVT